jgi:hypothetical protein
VKSLLVRLIIQAAFAATAVAALITFRHASLGVLATVILTYLSVLIVVIAIMLNYPRLPRQAMVNDFAYELEARNLLVSTSFRADRAFRVDEFAQEGPHYFLELEDGGILHLSGTYLYDYEPVEGSQRHFPCTQFTLRRHAEVGYVVDLICGGLVIEPEVEAPAYSADDFAQQRVPEDQAILRNVSFDRLLLERTTPKTSLQ